MNLKKDVERNKLVPVMSVKVRPGQTTGASHTPAQDRGSSLGSSLVIRYDMIVTISVSVSQRNGRLCDAVRVRYHPPSSHWDRRKGTLRYYRVSLLAIQHNSTEDIRQQFCVMTKVGLYKNIIYA